MSPKFNGNESKPYTAQADSGAESDERTDTWTGRQGDAVDEDEGVVEMEETEEDKMPKK